MREKITKSRKHSRSAADLPTQKVSDKKNKDAPDSDLKQLMNVPALNLGAATDQTFRKACKVEEALDNLAVSPAAAPHIALARAQLASAKDTTADPADRTAALTQAIVHTNAAIAQAQGDPNEATRLDADRKKALEQMLKEAA